MKEKRVLPNRIKDTILDVVLDLEFEVRASGDDTEYIIRYINNDEGLIMFLSMNSNTGFNYDEMFRQLDADANWEVVKE